MKKGILLVLLIAVLAVGGAFAQDFKISAGVGGLFGSDFGGGVKFKSSGQEATIDAPYAGTGFYAFADATYAEAFLSVFSPTGTITSTIGGKTTGIYKTSAGALISGEWTYSMLTFGILGKYPIVINDLITIFPALGIDYRLVSNVTWSNWKVDTEKYGKFDALWILGGVGLDFNLPIENVPLFLRLEALYGIRLQNKWEEYYINELKKSPGTEASAILGNGLTIRLAAGWKF